MCICVHTSDSLNTVLFKAETLSPCSLVAYSIGALNSNSVVKMKSTKLFFFFNMPKMK